MRIRKFNESTSTHSLSSIKIWKPSKDGFKQLVEVISRVFPNSKVTADSFSIKVSTGNITKVGSPTDWLMALANMLDPNGNGGEEIMRLFFWQNGDPLEDLIYMVDESERERQRGEEVDYTLGDRIPDDDE